MDDHTPDTIHDYLSSLSRSRLQSLAKQYNVKANQKSVVIIDELVDIFLESYSAINDRDDTTDLCDQHDNDDADDQPDISSDDTDEQQQQRQQQEDDDTGIQDECDITNQCHEDDPKLPRTLSDEEVEDDRDDQDDDSNMSEQHNSTVPPQSSLQLSASPSPQSHSTPDHPTCRDITDSPPPSVRRSLAQPSQPSSIKSSRRRNRVSQHSAAACYSTGTDSLFSSLVHDLQQLDSKHKESSGDVIDLDTADAEVAFASSTWPSTSSQRDAFSAFHDHLSYRSPDRLSHASIGLSFTSRSSSTSRPPNTAQYPRSALKKPRVTANQHDGDVSDSTPIDLFNASVVSSNKGSVSFDLENNHYALHRAMTVDSQTEDGECSSDAKRSTRVSVSLSETSSKVSKHLFYSHGSRTSAVEFDQEESGYTYTSVTPSPASRGRRSALSYCSPEHFVETHRALGNAPSTTSLASPEDESGEGFDIHETVSPYLRFEANSNRDGGRNSDSDSDDDSDPNEFGTPTIHNASIMNTSADSITVPITYTPSATLKTRRRASTYFLSPTLVVPHSMRDVDIDNCVMLPDQEELELTTQKVRLRQSIHTINERHSMTGELSEGDKSLLVDLNMSLNALEYQHQQMTLQKKSVSAKKLSPPQRLSYHIPAIDFLLEDTSPDPADHHYGPLPDVSPSSILKKHSRLLHSPFHAHSQHNDNSTDHASTNRYRTSQQQSITGSPPLPLIDDACFPSASATGGGDGGDAASITGPRRRRLTNFQDTLGRPISERKRRQSSLHYNPSNRKSFFEFKANYGHDGEDDDDMLVTGGHYPPRDDPLSLGVAYNELEKPLVQTPRAEQAKRQSSIFDDNVLDNAFSSLQRGLQHDGDSVPVASQPDPSQQQRRFRTRPSTLLLRPPSSAVPSSHTQPLLPLDAALNDDGNDATTFTQKRQRATTPRRHLPDQQIICLGSTQPTDLRAPPTRAGALHAPPGTRGGRESVIAPPSRADTIHKHTHSQKRKAPGAVSSAQQPQQRPPNAAGVRPPRKVQGSAPGVKGSAPPANSSPVTRTAPRTALSRKQPLSKLSSSSINTQPPRANTTKGSTTAKIATPQKTMVASAVGLSRGAPHPQLNRPSHERVAVSHGTLRRVNRK